MSSANKLPYVVNGKNAAAAFSLKVYRGEGMALLAMNWKKAKPSKDFVGFAIEYKEPGGTKFYTLKNRLSFPGAVNNANKFSTRLSPIQKFRWIHFPRNADLPGQFEYMVTPVFMNQMDELSYGEFQLASITLMSETYPNQLNVSFTRGFVSSQAFVDFYESNGPISTLLPDKAENGLDFKPTHPKTKEALNWMGFEARKEILDLLDKAIVDVDSQVRVIAYDLNEPEIVAKLEQLKNRLFIIIDEDGAHGETGSAENKAAARLEISAGTNQVKRQHMGKLQHNKIIVVDSPKIKAAVFGSTNFSWRGFYVQANNAVVVKGKKAISPFQEAFNYYWQFDSPKDFATTQSAVWNKLHLTDIDAQVCFSPHDTTNAMLTSIAEDIGKNTKSNLFFSLAFLYQTPGPILESINKITGNENIFVYGISDKKVGGFDFLKPDGNIAPVYPSALGKDVPEPFKSEPTGGGGTRMHHKFVIIDFDKPSARVYFGSYNFSDAADTKNGENLLLIKDKRIAVSYLLEALRLFDHYHFRVSQTEAKKDKKPLNLVKPPKAGEESWWEKYYNDVRRIRDRELFA